MTPKKELITLFKKQLQHLGYQKSTVNMLPSCIKDFFCFTQKEITEIEAKDILNFYDFLHNRPNKRRPGGLSESYINHHIYSLKTFFSWLMETRQCTKNPMSILNFKTPTNKPREILTNKEVKTLFENCDTNLEKAVLSIFYGCGLRRCEGEKLNLKDLSFRTKILYVREGKNNKTRAVPLSKNVSENLKKYIYNGRIYKENETALITNKLGHRMNGNRFNIILKKILQKAGIQKEITLHGLRHSIATHLLQSGLPLEYVRDFLGHKHLESTQIYTRISQKQLYEI